MAASSDTLMSVIDRLKNVAKNNNREKIDILTDLFRQLYDLGRASPPPGATGEVVLVDIDGTLIHGSNVEMVNDSLIDQLGVIKSRNPDVKIYLFSSMNLESLVKPEAINTRVRLFNQLESKGLIESVITTADLRYASEKAGSFYQEVFRPLMHAFYNPDGSKKNLTAADIQNELKLLSQDRDSVMFSVVQGFLETIDMEKSGETLLREFVNHTMNAVTTKQAYGISSDASPFEVKGTEKARLFRLFNESGLASRATLVDDSTECLASFIEVCRENGIPFLVHNAKDYMGYLDGTDLPSDQRLKLCEMLMVQEYSLFQSIYSAIQTGNRELYQLATDQLLNFYGTVSSLGSRSIQHLDSKVTQADIDAVEQSEQLRVELANKMSGTEKKPGFFSSSSKSKQAIEMQTYQIMVEQAKLEDYAARGNPLALYRLARALTPNAMPVFSFSRNQKNEIVERVEFGSDLVAAWHMANAALACWDKLPSSARFDELKKDLQNLIKKVEWGLGEAIDIENTAPEEVSIKIQGMNALELNRFLTLNNIAKESVESEARSSFSP